MSRDSAKRLLVHYFDQSHNFLLAGECKSEIESIVDHIVDAAVKEVLERFGRRGEQNGATEEGSCCS